MFRYMLHHSLPLIVTLTICAVTVGSPATVFAQQAGRVALTLDAGVAPYDLSGTGTTGVVGLASELRVGSVFIVEPTVRFVRYTTQFQSTTSILLPELSLQIQAPLGAVRPYIGAGGGGAFQVEGPADNDPTLHVALGIRTSLGNRWGLRTEARLRSVDPFHGSMVDFTAGISRIL